MNVIDDLIAALPGDAPVRDVRVGLHWTVVVVEKGGGLCAGLASTLQSDEDHHHSGGYPVQDAGKLIGRGGLELAALAHSSSVTEASIGLATINALLEVDLAACVELNAEEVIAAKGASRKVAVVGHFPFIPRISRLASRLWVLEKNPRGDDLPAEQAAEIIPQADVVAITGTSLTNHTFEGLASLCRPDAYVLLLGGSSPLSPVLFGYGVNTIAGTLVLDLPTVLACVSQGATFRQIKGKRLLNLERRA